MSLWFLNPNPFTAHTGHLLSDVLVGHVTRPGLGDEPGSLGPGAKAVRLVLVLCQSGQQEAVRQETFAGQHNAANTHTPVFTGGSSQRKPVFHQNHLPYDQVSTK